MIDLVSIHPIILILGYFTIGVFFGVVSVILSYKPDMTKEQLEKIKDDAVPFVFFWIVVIPLGLLVYSVGIWIPALVSRIAGFFLPGINDHIDDNPKYPPSKK